MRRSVCAVLLASVASSTLLLAAVAGTVRPVQSAQPAPDGYSGRLAVGRLDGIWLLPLDGSPPRRLVAVPDQDYLTGVAWSPGGDRVAYTRLPSDASGGELHVADLGGQDTLLVPPDQPADILARPAWLPDGSAILFDVTQLKPPVGGGSVYQIDRVSADGAHRSVELPAAYAPSLSRDGRLLAYLRRDAAGESIHLRALQGGPDVVVVPAGVVQGIVALALSPDGTTILFAATAGPGLQPGAGPCNPIGWSGGLLSVPTALAHGLPQELWRVAADGSGLTRLTSYCLDQPAVSWAPDGGWLAVFGGTNLLLLRPDGTSPVLIWRDGGYGGVDWTR